MLGNSPDFFVERMTWSQNQPYCLKSGKIYISISKITENVENFRIKVQNFGTENGTTWCCYWPKILKPGVFRPNFLKQVVVEIQNMEHPSHKFSKYPPPPGCVQPLDKIDLTVNWCLTLHVYKERIDALSMASIADEFVSRIPSRMNIFEKFED